MLSNLLFGLDHLDKFGIYAPEITEIQNLMRACFFFLWIIRILKISRQTDIVPIRYGAIIQIQYGLYKTFNTANIHITLLVYCYITSQIMPLFKEALYL